MDSRLNRGGPWTTAAVLIGLGSVLGAGVTTGGTDTDLAQLAQASGGTKASPPKGGSKGKGSGSKAAPKAAPEPTPAPTPTPEQAQAALEQQIAKLTAEYDQRVRDCRDQMAHNDFQGCFKALDDLIKTIPPGEQPEVVQFRKKLEVRRKLTEELQLVGPFDPEKEDAYYKGMFRAYASVPEEFFPFEEVMPIWNTYLRNEEARTRFQRYRSARVIARPANKEDPYDVASEALFYTHIQQKFLDYGFRLVDLSTTTASAAAGTTEVLVKLTLDGRQVPQGADPRMAELKHYQLVAAISTLKFTGSSGVSLPARDIRVVESDKTLDDAQIRAASIVAPRVVDSIFYLTLRQLFVGAS